MRADKAGTTTLNSYFDTEFNSHRFWSGGPPRPADDLDYATGWNPTRNKANIPANKAARVSLMVVRDPISRFISACEELLERYIGGHRTSQHTAWYGVWARTGQENMTALIRAFVDDVRCRHE